MEQCEDFLPFRKDAPGCGAGRLVRVRKLRDVPGVAEVTGMIDLSAWPEGHG